MSMGADHHPTTGEVQSTDGQRPPFSVLIIDSHEVLVDDSDVALMSKRNWMVRYKNGAGGRAPYPHVSWGNKALARVLIKAKRGQIVDHINGNPLDNRRENLRIATHSINAQNRRRPSANNKAGFLGVDYRPDRHPKKPYRAQIKLNGKKIHIGIFPTAQQAHEAYVETKRRIHEGCTL